MIGDLYTTRLDQSIEVLQSCRTTAIQGVVQEIADVMIDCLRSGHTIHFCGNGGSAADAQHLATELSGRFYINRRALSALTLGCNPALTTAIGNDYSFDTIFAREIQAIGKPNDLLIALSTSGNSSNIIKAIHEAKSKNMKIVGFTGKSGGKMSELCNLCLHIPSTDVPRIQEAHKVIGHTLCEYVEKNLA